MYRLIKSLISDSTHVVFRDVDNSSIPFGTANTDYQTFKKEVLAGAELQDADGNVMTDAAEYVRTLP
jgi:hypothetical protein